MRKKGWLEEVPGEDARSHPFRLTKEGKRLIDKVIPAWEKAQAEAKELLGHDFVSLLNGSSLSFIEFRKAVPTVGS